MAHPIITPPSPSLASLSVCQFVVHSVPNNCQLSGYIGYSALLPVTAAHPRCHATIPPRLINRPVRCRHIHFDRGEKCKRWRKNEKKKSEAKRTMKRDTISVKHHISQCPSSLGSNWSTLFDFASNLSKISQWLDKTVVVSALILIPPPPHEQTSVVPVEIPYGSLQSLLQWGLSFCSAAELLSVHYCGTLSGQTPEVSSWSVSTQLLITHAVLRSQTLSIILRAELRFTLLYWERQQPSMQQVCAADQSARIVRKSHSN